MLFRSFLFTSCVALVGCARMEPTGDVAATADLAADLAADPATVVDRAQRAEAVFAGEVRRIEYAMSQPSGDDPALPFTFVTWRVDVAMRGVRAGQEFTARFLGGPLPDGGALDVTEMPHFAVGDRDVLFIRRNGEIGCPLVDGARGRIQLAAAGRTLDPASPSSANPELPAAVARAIDGAALAGSAARSADPRAPFTFAMPRAATHAQMARAAERLRAARAAADASPNTH
jgi:hypothetical protein